MDKTFGNFKNINVKDINYKNIYSDGIKGGAEWTIYKERGPWTQGTSRDGPYDVSGSEYVRGKKCRHAPSRLPKGRHTRP